MLEFFSCKKIYIDFDGVIVDSNKFKELAIRKSIYFINGQNKKSDLAIKYFNVNAGLPREKKLSKFFNFEVTDKIMKLYAKKCKESYLNSKPIIGTLEFLEYLNKKYKEIDIYVLSGGEKNEISKFILDHKMNNFFSDILASNKLKSQHLMDTNASKNDYFIGDSKRDLETAINHPLKFIYIKGYNSQLSSPSLNNLRKADFISNDLLSLTKFI